MFVQSRTKVAPGKLWDNRKKYWEIEFKEKVSNMKFYYFQLQLRGKGGWQKYPMYEEEKSWFWFWIHSFSLDTNIDSLGAIFKNNYFSKTILNCFLSYKNFKIICSCPRCFYPSITQHIYQEMSLLGIIYFFVVVNHWLAQAAAGCLFLIQINELFGFIRQIFPYLMIMLRIPIRPPWDLSHLTIIDSTTDLHYEGISLLKNRE